MGTRTQKIGAALALVLLFGAVFLSCHVAIQNSMAAMAMGQDVQTATVPDCCAVRPLSTHDALRGYVALPNQTRVTQLLLFALGILLFAGVARGRTRFTITALARLIRMLGLQRQPSGLEEALRRGIIHPRLYEPAVVLS